MLFTQLLMFYLGHWYGDIVRLRTIHNDFDLWVIECAPMPSSWPVVSCNVQLSIAVQTRKNPSILLPVVVGSDDDYCARAARLVVTKQRFKGGNKRRINDEYDRNDFNQFQRFFSLCSRPWSDWSTHTNPSASVVRCTLTNSVTREVSSGYYSTYAAIGHPHSTLCGTIDFASAVNPRL